MDLRASIKREIMTQLDIKLKITEQDIARGKKFSLNLCPVGIAATRAFPNTTIAVGYVYVSSESDDEYRLYVLPRFAKEFLEAFEAGKKVTPVEFDLKIVEKSCKRKSM